MMNYRLLITVLLVAGTGFVAPSCKSKDKPDRVINVEDDDKEMAAAMAKARTGLPAFWETFGNPTKGEEKFALKVRITDDKGAEHFWVNEIERKDGKVFGTINNDPDIVKNVRLGQRIKISEPDISDWLYMRKGKMIGNYTLRVLFKQMPAKEVEFYKKMLEEP